MVGRMVGPKLRRLERRRMRRAGEDLLVLRDPLELAEPFAIDAEFEPVLDALDGQRTLAQVRQSLLMRGLALVELDDLRDFVSGLSEAGLLDDERFRELWAADHAKFVEQELRMPRRAGLLYPDDPRTLLAWLADALPQPEAGPFTAGEATHDYGAPPIAVVAPHQPPPLVADPLRRLLSKLPPPEHYRRIVILATDHAPGLLPYASADKDWVTPLGTVPCDLELLARLDERLPWLLREQTRLRVSDSIEWTTLLLRALWGRRCPPILPLACGQTRLTTREGAEQALELTATLGELLGELSSDGEVLCWTSAELSHVGPAYGHAELPERAQVERDDRELLAPLLDNNPSQLARRCMERPAASRPSGAAALATLADLLPTGYRASLIDLSVVPAPGDDRGWIGCPTISIS